MEEEESTVRWLLFWWITLVASVAFSASPFESDQRCSGIHTSDYTLHGLEAKLDMPHTYLESVPEYLTLIVNVLFMIS